MNKPVSKRVAPKAAPKPRAARKAAPKVEPAAPPPAKPKNIITAGIKALTNAHEEAIARQSRVFESLLGIGAKRESRTSEPDAATTLDPFGIKKFEDVFDQRVARALTHLGLPTAQAFADLQSEVAALRDQVARLEAQGPRR